MSNLPAPNFNAAAPLLQAQQIQSNQTGLQTGQTQLQRLQRVNQGEDIQFRNQLIRDAAAHSIDSDAWDAAMQSAVKRGAPEAQQFVGRYTPLLQQRLFETYGGAAPTSAAGGTASAAAPAGGTTATPTDMLDRIYANVTPQQMATSLQKNNAVLSILSGIKDQPTLDAAHAKLAAMGIPGERFLGQTYTSLVTPQQLNQLYNQTQQRAGYLQSRVAAAATGQPDPLVKNEMKDVGGQLYSADPYSGQAKPMTPPETEVVPNAFWKDGSPILKTKTGGIVPQGGVTVAEAARRTQNVENATGDPNAKNPRSSATGNGQFTDSTWLDTIKQARPDLAKAMNDKQLLMLRGDSQFSTEMTEELAKNNIAALTKAGLPVTTATVALAHRFGAGDVTKLLNAAPNTPMEQLFPPKNGKDNPVIAANPDLVGKTAGQVAQDVARKGGNDPVEVPGEQQIFHKGDYDKPQLVEVSTDKNKKLYPSGIVPDDVGGTDQVLAQQHHKTGQWFTADERRIPIDATGSKIIPESMAAGGGSRVGAQVMRILINAHDATSEIRNIAELPLSASSGWAAGRGQAPGLINAAKEVLTQKVLPQEVQDFNTSMIGLGRAMAMLESGGLTISDTVMKQYDRLALQEGDTNLTKMRKLGTMRQQTENALKGTMSSPFVGKAQREQINTLMKDLVAAVPWTPSDVTKLQQAKNPAVTMKDFAQGQGIAAIPAPDQRVKDKVYTTPKGPARWTGAGWELVK
jgi:hypothetical protein